MVANVPNLRRIDTLTERERQVLTLVGVGMSDKEISGRLCRSVTTVRTTLRRVGIKLETSRRSTMVLFSVAAGLVRLPGPD